MREHTTSPQAVKLTALLWIATALAFGQANGQLQEKQVQSPGDSAAAELTAEGYRDLIVNTSDPLRKLDVYGQLTAGGGTCIATFTATEPVPQRFSIGRTAWATARVPMALEASHAEVLKWMDVALTTSKGLPACFLPLLQAGPEQWAFIHHMGSGYDEVRKNAATALASMGVTLPPMIENTPVNRGPTRKNPGDWRRRRP